MQGVPVELALAGTIASVLINRPEAGNALSRQVVEQLRAVFDSVAADSRVEGVLLCGAGGTFVAGADTEEFLQCIEAGRFEEIVALIRSAQELLLTIDRSPKPVVACVGGAALGGGLELALACDWIVASPRAVLAFPETGLGVFPSGGGTQRTPRRIGAGLAKWLILTGGMIAAVEAHMIGLIDFVVPQEAMPSEAIRVARQWPNRRLRPELPAKYARLERFFEEFSVEAIREGRAKANGNSQLDLAVRRVGEKAPLAQRVAERLINDALRTPLEEGLRRELAHVLPIYQSRDARNGLLAIRNRAKPVFEGC